MQNHSPVRIIIQFLLEFHNILFLVYLIYIRQSISVSLKLLKPYVVDSGKFTHQRTFHMFDIRRMRAQRLLLEVICKFIILLLTAPKSY